MHCCMSHLSRALPLADLVMAPICCTSSADACSASAQTGTSQSLQYLALQGSCLCRTTADSMTGFETKMLPSNVSCMGHLCQLAGLSYLPVLGRVGCSP